ncbi:hypothetical protein AJ79_02106 [Helicocarpus griseus UAMH5409]|uniref:Signal peptidase complex catalytic subunit SEC11 n=1 Tax=Helicocarpus griseus UAMH5409 TaxID=1447875 RepID=A0A2B7Y467_9EURO|nr:hypothetical protein AJ79_02106 [Helicocarpus griseus UAMH5409]
MPVTVVTSHSMTPTFERGDILFLWNRDPAIHVGEIPVIWFPGSPLPMVHRAIKVFFDEDNVSSSGYKAVLTTSGDVGSLSRQRILTKGDGNMADDTLLYPQSQKFVSREEVLGVVRGSLPLLGWVSIVFTQYPWISNLGTGLVVALLLLGYTRRTSLS